MEKYTDIYEKAGVLMQSALKKYAENDIEGGNADRTEANRLYDMAENSVKQDFNNIMYGESRNFGIIYNVIEANTKNLCEDRTKRNTFAKIVKLIKEDKSLKTQFDFFNCLTHPNTKIFDIEQYVNEALSIVPKLNIDTVKKSNDNLINEIKKNKLNELVDIDEDTMALYESIEYLLFNKPTFANLSEYSNAKKNVITYLGESVNNDENVTNAQNIDEAIDTLIEKYDSLLNDDEKELIETVMKSENKKALFENYREEAIKKIEETLSKTEDNELKTICEEIKSKEYNKQTVLGDISKFIEIANILS